MFGAVVGDIIGSLYAYDTIRTKDFPLFDMRCRFTDDTVFLCASATCLRRYIENGKQGSFLDDLREDLLDWGWKYQDVTYSSHFTAWMFDDDHTPYGSAGITAASRAVAAGFLAETLEEAMDWAEQLVTLTHAHPEGIKGARCVAGAVFLARCDNSKAEIKDFVAKNFYEFQYSLKDLQRGFQFFPTCPAAVMPAILAFTESKDFEDAIRNVISMGASDSMAAITGGIAEAFYGIPDEIVEEAATYIDEDIENAIWGE